MAEKTRKVPYTLKPGHTFCPGCGHGVFLHLLHEVFEEKGLLEKNVCAIGVGCSSTYNNVTSGGNRIECHHGRAPSTAYGMKMVDPSICCWTYQGDGDAYAIGMGETVQAAHDGRPVSVFIINNTNYGMTGGQTAYTTLHGQVTSTAPNGFAGQPFDFMPHVECEAAPLYAARGSTATLAECNKLKKYIAKAIDAQMKYNGYGVVEIVSPCPTNWHMAPTKAVDHIMKDVVEVFKLGEFVNRLPKEEK